MEHVVEKGNAGVGITVTLTINVDSDLDVGFFGGAGNRCGTSEKFEFSCRGIFGLHGGDGCRRCPCRYLDQNFGV